MDNESKDELFSLKLNSEGMGYILRIIRLAKLFIVLGIFISIISLAKNIVSLFQKRLNYNDDFLNIFFTLYPFISIAGLIFFILQLFFCQKMANSFSESIKLTDDKSFNSSFENLAKGIWYAIAVALFSLLYTSVEFYFLIKY